MSGDSTTPKRRRPYRLWGLLGLAGLLLLGALGLRWWAGRTPDPLAESPLPAPFCRLEPLHNRLSTPEPGEWLAENQEFGQTYVDFARAQKLRPPSARRVLEIQPLGTFRPAQRQLVEQAGEFLGRYYQLPVRVCEDLPLEALPEDACRRLADGTVEVQTGALLRQVLSPRVSDDARARVAITVLDLWSSDGEHYVYGQAIPAERVGVFSFHWFGDPEESPQAASLVRRRTLAAAAHETGHLFNLLHCTWYNCVMCGCNGRKEVDRHSLELCPQCLAKACCVTGADPWKRCDELLAFAQAQGLTQEAAFWQKSRQALGEKP